MKNVLGNVALNKILSIIKRDLSHKVDYTNELSEDDVRQLWNDVTGDQIPNILSLQHNHDELYSKLNHLHDDRYSLKDHNHDGSYYIKSQVNENFANINHVHDIYYRKNEVNANFSNINHSHGNYSQNGHTHDEIYYSKQEVDTKFLMKRCKRMPDNYVMNCDDFLTPGFYHLGVLSSTPAKNAPPNNVGDYLAYAFCDNYPFQVLLTVSPRDTAHMYIGRFWNREFIGWGVINFDKSNED